MANLPDTSATLPVCPKPSGGSSSTPSCASPLRTTSAITSLRARLVARRLEVTRVRPQGIRIPVTGRLVAHAGGESSRNRLAAIRWVAKDSPCASAARTARRGCLRRVLCGQMIGLATIPANDPRERSVRPVGSIYDLSNRILARRIAGEPCRRRVAHAACHGFHAVQSGAFE